MRTWLYKHPNVTLGLLVTIFIWGVYSMVDNARDGGVFGWLLAVGFLCFNTMIVNHIEAWWKRT